MKVYDFVVHLATTERAETVNDSLKGRKSRESRDDRSACLRCCDGIPPSPPSETNFRNGAPRGGHSLDSGIRRSQPMRASQGKG
jgi:hypothetical protein